MAANNSIKAQTKPRSVQFVERNTAELLPSEQNARTHSTRQISKIARSIEKFGFLNPVIIDSKNLVIAGHGRLQAAKLLGLDTVPCILAEHLTDIERRAYMLADNRLAEDAGWDEKILQAEIRALIDAEFDAELTGFEGDELSKLLGLDDGDGKDEDETPDAPENPITSVGELWALGEHRLFVGDATKRADVQALIGDGKANMVWTDPPYNVAIQGKAGKIKNDDMTDAAFREFLDKVFANYYRCLAPGACIYVAHADSERLNFTAAFKGSGLKLSQVLIWVKQAATLSRQDYNWQHEPILYGWKEGAGHFFAGDFTLTTVIDDDIDIDKMKVSQLIELNKQLRAALRTTVVRHDRPTVSDLHPTMKPVKLVRDQIEASSHRGQVVVDLFGGSGTTLIAAETCGRQARLMELDPKFADVIIIRWQEFTGRKAKRQGDGVTFNKLAGLAERSAA